MSSSPQPSPLVDAATVTQASPALGAVVTGVHLADAGPAEVAAFKSLLNVHMVLFFPDQHLTVDQHVAFGRQFGQMEAHPNLRNSVEHPEVFELAASRGGIADEWHTDLTFRASPSLLSILNMVDCPEIGGDTMWTNLCLAYEALSPPLRDLCDGLSALHDAHPHGRPEAMAIHPVVRIHPDTGRKVLYVNEHFTRRIVEMGHVESESLLSLLTGWVSQERFTVRHRWSKGTIAIWDNRCTQHFVLNDFVGERLIQRVTITGDHPEGDGGPRWPPHDTTMSATARFDRQLAGFLRARGS